MRTVESVLFDMDGVVLDSMKCHAGAWIAALSEFGICVQEHDIFIREGMTGKDSIIDIFADKGVKNPGIDELNRLIEIKLSVFKECSIHPFPLIDDILEFLSSKNVPMALVTGSLRRSVDQILPERIRGFFSVVITADDVTRGKPDPEPYSAALRSLGVNPDTAVAVENAPMGIRSAVDAGLRCIALETTLNRGYLRMASMVLQDHPALYQFFKKALT